MIFRSRLDAMLLGATLACASCDGSPASSPPPTDEAPEVSAKPRTEPDAVVANTTPPSKPAAVVAPPSSYEPRADDPTTAEFPLENPKALAHFYDALARVEKGDKEVVQVVHLGASMIGADDLTSLLRGKFQTRFGDGGAGMVLLRRFMTNYLHKWVKLDAKKWDNCYIGYLCDKSGRYGLGGVAFYGQHSVGDMMTRAVSDVGLIRRLRTGLRLRLRLGLFGRLHGDLRRVHLQVERGFLEAAHFVRGALDENRRRRVGVEMLGLFQGGDRHGRSLQIERARRLTGAAQAVFVKRRRAAQSLPTTASTHFRRSLSLNGFFR